MLTAGYGRGNKGSGKTHAKGSGADEEVSAGEIVQFVAATMFLTLCLCLYDQQDDFAAGLSLMCAGAFLVMALL